MRRDLRGMGWGLGVALALALSAAPAAAAKASAQQPIVGTDKLAQPAEPAPPEGSRKRFIKGASPSRMPPSKVKTGDRAGPIFSPMTLKGHRESPPTTTAPLKQSRVGKAANGPGKM